VHGNAKLIGATIFPHNVGLGAAHDPELIYRIDGRRRRKSPPPASTGHSPPRSPWLAMCDGPFLRKLFRVAGAGGAICARDGGGIARPRGHGGFHVARHTLSSVKHFVGDGATLDGRDQGDARVPELNCGTCTRRPIRLPSRRAP